MAERILIGADIANPLYTFDNATIQSCSCVLSSALSGDELAIDQFMPVVYSAAYITVKFVPKGSDGFLTKDGSALVVYPNANFLDKLPYSTPIWYFSDDVLVGKFYSQRIVRTGKTAFDVLAVSAIGVLEGQEHNGGIYTGQTFETVAREIIGESFAFSCADDVKNILIYGWLPIDTKRNNLHQLLFACGVMLDKDSNGTMFFRFPDTNSVKNVPDSRIFLGGRVDFMTPATRAEVTEHIFEALSTDEEALLYDNTQGGELAVNTKVVFAGAPIHDLSTTGTLEIIESGVNYAIVSGTGTLSGKRYTHITRVVDKTTGKGGEDKLVSVTEATLVSVANSENVCSRVLSYYSSVRTVYADIILNGERPGEQISFNNPFEEPERAFLSMVDIRSGSFLRASCELVTGYLPSGGGNNYTKVVTLSGSGTWTVPNDIPINEDGYGKIRVAVIQGGWGGNGGYMGTAGQTTSAEHDQFYGNNPCYWVYSGRTVGVGGSPGAPGLPGKVLVFTINVMPGQSFDYSSGVGGIGGAGQTASSGPQNGTEGGETTFGPYSSANGAIMDGGYFDVIENVLYANTGALGTIGENGFLGGYQITDSGEGPTGSAPFSGYWIRTVEGTDWSVTYETAGAGSGGSAYGVSNPPGATTAELLSGSQGGSGATPIKPNTPSALGMGGDAGHGGGGGGTGGTLHMLDYGPFVRATIYSRGGSGGNGGAGGDGAPGGVVIYY